MYTRSCLINDDVFGLVPLVLRAGMAIWAKLYSRGRRRSAKENERKTDGKGTGRK